MNLDWHFVFYAACGLLAIAVGLTGMAAYAKYGRKFFERKEIDTLLREMESDNRLRRALGPIGLTSLGVGAIIGAGIFVMTGRVAATDAGPAIVVSYIVAAVACALAAFCYAEFASMAPVAGSAYTYSYATMGEVFAWIIGWDLILEYGMSCATVASAWSKYFNLFLKDVFGEKWTIPERYWHDPFTYIDSINAYGLVNLPAILIMFLVTAILIIGIRESATMNSILVVVKLAVVLIVIVLGATIMNPSYWTSIPISERILPGETEVDITVSTIVKDKIYLAKIEDVKKSAGTDAEKSNKLRDLAEQQKVTTEALVGIAKAQYRELAVKNEVTRQLEQKQTTKEEGDKLINKAAGEKEAKLVILAQKRKEKNIELSKEALELLPTILKEVEANTANSANEKWGMLAPMGVAKALKPLDESVRSNFFPYGFSGVMLGASMVFFAFIGFDSISTHSEEAKNPARDVPIGIIASLVICTILYILVSGVITAIQPYPTIDRSTAVASAFSQYADKLQAEGKPGGLFRSASALISIGGLAGMTSVLLVTFLSQSRVFLAMARDKLLPPSVFGAVHPVLKTPHISTFWTGLIVALIAGFTPIEKLEVMVNIGTLFAFAVVCAAVLILRVQNPTAHRPFRCPAVWIVAPLGLLINVILMLFLPIDSWADSSFGSDSDS